MARRPTQLTETAAPIETEARSAYDGELRFAVDLADRAGRLLVDRYERVERIDYKSARDIVTEVDHLSEELVLTAIRERYPDDAILTEESGEHRAVRGESTSMLIGRTWVVDPLDGTVNYANGLPFFCVAIGLVIDGQPTLGVVRDPIREETLSSTADGPTRLDGPRSNGPRQVSASDKEKLSDFVISLSLSGRAVTSRLRAVRKAVRISRTMGSAALALAYVGNGRFDAFVQQGGLSAWDVAAAGLIAERGGARVTDMNGGAWFDLSRSTRSVSILAAPAPHHAALLDLVSTQRSAKP